MEGSGRRRPLGHGSEARRRCDRRLVVPEEDELVLAVGPAGPRRGGGRGKAVLWSGGHRWRPHLFCPGEAGRERNSPLQDGHGVGERFPEEEGEGFGFRLAALAAPRALGGVRGACRGGGHHEEWSGWCPRGQGRAPRPGEQTRRRQNFQASIGAEAAAEQRAEGGRKPLDKHACAGLEGRVKLPSESASVLYRKRQRRQFSTQGSEEGQRGVALQPQSTFWWGTRSAGSAADGEAGSPRLRAAGLASQVSRCSSSRRRAHRQGVERC